MYFLIHKFSEFLNYNKINHTLNSSEYASEIVIDKLDDKLRELLSNARVSIDISNDITEYSKEMEVPVFQDGKIIIDHNHIGEYISVLHNVVRDYLYNTNRV